MSFSRFSDGGLIDRSRADPWLYNATLMIEATPKLSVYVASLAFTDAALIDEAKVGIVAASVLAATLGVAVLSLVGRGREAAAGTPR